MRNKILAGGFMVLLAGMAASAGMAQTHMQQRGSNQAVAHPSVDAANTVTLVGTVRAVNLAPGQGMPQITLSLSNGSDATIMVGPYRVLADTKFEIKEGQALEVKAFQDPRTPDAFVAMELKDTATGATATLRSAAGMPPAGRGGRGMMRGGGMMRGMGGPGGMRNGVGACADCANLDLKAKTTLTGTVMSVDMAPGQGFPNFTLQAGGTTYTVAAGPYWALQQADFRISQGDQLSVDAYPSLQHQNAWVAAVIRNNSTQKSIQLRDENGLPLARRGRGPMNGIQR